jgi:hypothetical protein
MFRGFITLGLVSITTAITLHVALRKPPLLQPAGAQDITGKKSLAGGTVSKLQTSAHAEGNVQTAAKSSRVMLQPEAVKLIRRIGGERFKSNRPPILIVYGILATGLDHQNVQISRYQDVTGERVEITVASGPRLSWDSSSGARSSIGTLALSERALVERLVFDSVDQFILAQLRGASYYRVAQNVRPDDADESYTGPTWDVIRVDDPETDYQKQPLSRWRMYYLDNNTGLIDMVVSESQGERVKASFSDWVQRTGEKFPSTITWTSQGQTLMTLTLTEVSFVAQ